MPSSSRVCLRPLSVAAQGSAYLLTQRSWTSLIGTGFRKWSFSRPRFRVVTSPASSSTLRCFITPKRDIGRRCSSAVSVWPSRSNSSSSRPRRVGSARALNTSSMAWTIRDLTGTCQARSSLTGMERPSWVDAELYPYEDRWAELDGHAVHYVDEGDGPPLLMLHG